MHYQTIWLILLIVFAGIEGITAGLVSIWFCAGSLVALVATWLGHLCRYRLGCRHCLRSGHGLGAAHGAEMAAP